MQTTNTLPNALPDTLTDEQQDIVRTFGRGMAVLAGAGCGKTTTLVMKCRELLERNPNARFAAVSFTERSASDLKLKLSDIVTAGPSRQPDNHGDLHGGSNLVATIHGLCAAIMREYPREAGIDGDEGMLSESEGRTLWEKATQALWLDDIPDDVRQALELLLERDTRMGVLSLLGRVKELDSFGVFGRLEASGDPVSLALARVAVFTLNRYGRLKRRAGLLDFDDLERAADKALDVSVVREAYQRRFDLVLVDEFQDTNPLQASILLRFARPDLSNLCVVGDPKQSIYRFRDADVGVFEEFCRKLPLKKSLTWNFRSRPAIIEFANKTCKDLFTASQLEYEPLVAKREATPQGHSVVRLDVTDPSQLARWIKGEADNGIPLHDIAVIMRKIRGNEKWLRSLAASGIPLVVGGGGFFWEDPRVREGVAFLKWWNNPANELSGAVFLRAPWVRVGDETIDSWLREGEDLRDAFLKSDHSLARVLANDGKVHTPGELLLKLLGDAHVERELGARLLGLWHRAEELSSGGRNFHEVTMELSSCIEESRREREVPPPKNSGRLSVLTIHGAKGLEFPHVILVDFGKKQRAQAAPVLYWDRLKGAHVARRDEDGERVRDDPQERQWNQLERAKELAESKRLFYVAITRAKERLVMAFPELYTKAAAGEADPLTQDDWRGWVEAADAPCEKISLQNLALHEPGITGPAQSVEVYGEVSGEPSGTAAIRSVRRVPSRIFRPSHSVTEWNLLSKCPRAYEWTYVRPITTSALTYGADGDLYRGVSQQEVGTRVHACLERDDAVGLRDIEREIGKERFNAESVIQWASSSRLMARRMARRTWTELSFEVVAGDEVLVGVIDRLIDFGGTYAVVDFKVSATPKTRAELLQAYQNQIELYSWSVSKLEPDASLDAQERFIASISPRGVEEFKVPYADSGVARLITRLAAQASEIVQGRTALPVPGPLCARCDFRDSCESDWPGRAG